MCQWLLWATNEFSLVNVNLQRFGMNGQMLCNLGKERFLELAPDFVGDILWEHLEQMIKGTAAGLGEVGTQTAGGVCFHLRLPRSKSPCFRTPPSESNREVMTGLHSMEGSVCDVHARCSHKARA